MSRLSHQQKARIKSVAYANLSFRKGFLQPFSLFHTYVWSKCKDGFNIRFLAQPRDAALHRAAEKDNHYRSANKEPQIMTCCWVAVVAKIRAGISCEPFL
jgi:hypothetical protein